MEHLAPSLTPIGLFFQAGPVAKAVLLTLLAASIWCWGLIIEGIWCIRRLNQAVRAARNDVLHPSTELLVPIIDAGRRGAAPNIPGRSGGGARPRVAAHT